MAPVKSLAGVDGCPGGWVAAIDRGGPIEIVVVRGLAELLSRETFDVVAIDIPIGLTETGSRAADVEARSRLGRVRGTSVMPAPIRAAAYETTHPGATAARRAVEGKGVSIQAFGIYRKVAEVDTLLRENPALREVVVEAHPELSFAHWNGGPILARKKGAEGKAIRRRLVEAEFGPVPAFERPPRSVAMDDVLDAYACLWTARRVAAGRQVPYGDGIDAEGLTMRIVA